MSRLRILAALIEHGLFHSYRSDELYESIFPIPPPVWAYPTNAYASGIATAISNNDWLLNNFYLQITADRKLASTHKISAASDLLYHPRLGADALEQLGLVKSKTVNLSDYDMDSLARYLSDCFKTRRDVYFWGACNKYYIPKTVYYGRRSHPHSILIIGVSVAKRLFKCVFQTVKGYYEKVDVPFRLMWLALCSSVVGEEARRRGVSVLRELTATGRILRGLDRALIGAQVRDFLESICEHTHKIVPDISPRLDVKSSVCGLSALRVMREHITICEKSSGYPDVRATRLLMEHAVLMKNRIVLLHKHFGAAFGGLEGPAAQLSIDTSKLHVIAASIFIRKKHSSSRELKACVGLINVIINEYEALYTRLSAAF